MRRTIYPCDLTDLDACDKVIDDIIKDLGGINVLVNNAGRSIRRSIQHSYDRFHDFERTMQLNYFGSLRLIMRCLPHMTKAREGQFVNISSIGVLSNAPRFSAYVASKAALDAFSRCASTEFSDTGVSFTTINMPLVRTPMIAPTKIYDHVPTISPEEAADMVKQAVIYRPAAHRNAPGNLCAGAACGGAEDVRDRDEQRVPHVPRLDRAQGNLRRPGPGQPGTDRLREPDARYSLVGIAEPRAVRGVENRRPGCSAQCWFCRNSSSSSSVLDRLRPTSAPPLRSCLTLSIIVRSSSV